MVFERGGDGRLANFSPTSPFPPRASQAGAYVGGRLFMFGGAAGVLIDEGWTTVLDDSSRAWTRSSALPEPRSELAVTASGDLLFAGGGRANTDAGQGPNAALWVARVEPDGGLSPWASSTLADPRADHQLVVHDSWLYAIGGYDQVDGPADVKNAHLTADGGIDSVWGSATGVPPGARRGHGAVVIGDYLYVIGGTLAGGPTADVRYGRFDKLGGIVAWSSATPLPSARAYAAVVAF